MLLLGIYPKKMKTQIQKDICTPMVMAVLFTIAKMWKQSKCPSVDIWVRKMWYTHTHTHTHTHWNTTQPSERMNSCHLR